MGNGILLKLLLSFARLLYRPRKHHPLLHLTMGQNSRCSSVKEIQDSIVESLQPYTQLINPVPQEIRFGSPEFMAEIPQPFDLDQTFVLRVWWQAIEPFENRS